MKGSGFGLALDAIGPWIDMGTIQLNHTLRQSGQGKCKGNEDK